MTKPSPLVGEAYVLIARRFAVLAEPTRLQLLHALIDEEKNVTELVKLTRGTPANISRHLQTLAQANLLTRRKAGLQVFYAIGDPTIFKLCELACASLEGQLTQHAKALEAVPAAGNRRRR